jgi:hypothetical protein
LSRNFHGIAQIVQLGFSQFRPLNTLTRVRQRPARFANRGTGASSADAFGAAQGKARTALAVRGAACATRISGAPVERIGPISDFDVGVFGDSIVSASDVRSAVDDVDANKITADCTWQSTNVEGWHPNELSIFGRRIDATRLQVHSWVNLAALGGDPWRKSFSSMMSC